MTIDLGTTVPAAAMYPLTGTNADFDDAGSVSADGTTLSGGCEVGSQFYVDSTTYTLDPTPVPRGTCTGNTVTASPTVTDANRVQFGSSLGAAWLVTPVGLLGVGTVGPPTCTADLVSATVTCSDLNAGSFAVTLNSGSPVPLVSTENINPAPYSGGIQYTGTARVPGLASGGTLTLDETSPTVITRHLTTLHLAALTVNENSSGTVVSGTCQPNKVFTTAGYYNESGATGPLCPSSGTFSSLTSGATAGVVDDLSGGSTTVSVPSLSTLIPTPDDSVPGSAFTAYAVPVSASTSVPALSEIRSVSLSIVPHGGTTPVFTGTGTGPQRQSRPV